MMGNYSLYSASLERIVVDGAVRAKSPKGPSRLEPQVDMVMPFNYLPEV